MEPKIRAIDLALKLNLDEHGNPKPMPKRPIRINTTFPSVDPLIIADNKSSLMTSDINSIESFLNETSLSQENHNQKGE